MARDWRTSRTGASADSNVFKVISGRGERRTIFGDAARLQVSFAAHDGREAGGVIAPGVGVIGQAGGHKQRAEIGVAKPKRPEIMRIARDGPRSDSRSLSTKISCAVMRMSTACR